MGPPDQAIVFLAICRRKYSPIFAAWQILAVLRRKKAGRFG
jgi:hypothetical protein